VLRSGTAQDVSYKEKRNTMNTCDAKKFDPYKTRHMRKLLALTCLYINIKAIIITMLCTYIALGEENKS
jgi:hypothetical protein